MPTDRRTLTFATLDDAVREAERLLAAGYDRAGNWDLAQCLDHLTAWLTYPVAGFPRQWLPVRAAFAVVRTLMGRAMLTKFLAEGMPAGKPTLKQSVVAAGGDPAEALERFRAAVARFQGHAGEYLPSPLFGTLTRGEALTVQLRHAAHHLSFLVPRG